MTSQQVTEFVNFGTTMTLVVLIGFGLHSKWMLRNLGYPACGGVVIIGIRLRAYRTSCVLKLRLHYQNTKTWRVWGKAALLPPESTNLPINTPGKTEGGGVARKLGTSLWGEGGGVGFLQKASHCSHAHIYIHIYIYIYIYIHI